MNKEFAPYTEALELKQLGFDKPCFAFWDAYNGGAHLFFERRVQYSWLISIFIKPPPVFECSQGLIEHEEGDNCILAPTYSQAFRWFREFREYDDWCIESWIQPYLSDEPRQHEAFYWRRGEKVSVGVFSTYDEAQLGLLRKLIEIVKTKQ